MRHCHRLPLNSNNHYIYYIMIITKTDPVTGKQNSLDIPVTETQIESWRLGALIQDAMPDLTPDQREFIMTGIMPDSWERIFGEEQQ